jgi:uncharacterized protein with FMN-binding domain
LPSSVPRHSVPYALLGALALTGCGDKKPHRSNQPASVPASTATATATPSASNAKASRTVTGKDVLTRFGDIQVAITLKSGRITDVKPVTLPSDRPRSQYISEQASPILRSEVLAAQSARINLVSGATYTSDAWAQSVQSAIDQAG